MCQLNNSPVYEDLGDEFPETSFDISCSNENDCSMKEVCEFSTSGTKENVLNSEKPNQEESIPSNIQNSSQTNQIKTPKPYDFNSEEIFLLKQWEKDNRSEQYLTTSQGSAISELPEPAPNEDKTDKVSLKSNNILPNTHRKRTYSGNFEEEPAAAKISVLTNTSNLQGTYFYCFVWLFYSVTNDKIFSDYDKLLPFFVSKLTAEKNRLLNNIENKLTESIMDSYMDTVNSIKQSIASHESAIKEKQIILKSTIENLELHHKVLQQNQTELEE